MPALFYAKAGSLYVSDPAGTPGRKLTDGPADTQPAPSPDGTRVAYVHKNSASDYGGELWVLDLAEDAPAGAPHRLVDPAALPPPPGIDSGRSSTRAGHQPASRSRSCRTTATAPWPAAC
ncbi:TolB family protein [Mycobacterium liflandii]|uniref:TolB family protein n=1 Tax=Mycobacterium liflandii TaxID=261524 RepID=UPI000A71F09D|nr:hypothetical protein [Mycobacterium liflandii]